MFEKNKLVESTENSRLHFAMLDLPREKQLDNRLTMLSTFVRPSARVADIGADHAHLSIHLIRKKIASHVIAVDVADMPYARAVSAVSSAGLEQNIEVRQGNGLSIIQPDEVDDIVIAGMGGMLTADILQACNWIRSDKYRIILAPVTSASDLRIRLCKMGFAVISEQAVSARGRVYTIMGVKYEENPTQADILYPYIGRLTDNATADNLCYLERELRHQKRRRNGDIKIIMGIEQAIENMSIALKTSKLR